MRRPQIVVLERDGRLARMLDALASDKKWVLRESRQMEATLRLVSATAPSLLVVRLSPAATAELTVISRCNSMIPKVATVVIVDADADAALPGLAWDLDADMVLGSNVPLERLPAIVEGLMTQP